MKPAKTPMHTKFQKIILLFICFACFNACEKIDTNPLSANAESFSTLAAGKMNIILMLADDVGFETLNVDGGKSYNTKNINALAAQGIRFPNTYSTPLCSPSRFELLTSKYNFRNYGLWGIMDTTNRTIANMLRDAGYKTMVAGKWQLDGGDASIHALGFNDYMVYTPFQNSGVGKGSRYKNPTLYQYGKLLNKDSMKGKYGEDVLVNYIEKYIDSNKKGPAPFFIYYPICLCHAPFSPTPDDPEFAAWDPGHNNSDKSFFPSMMNYMDKKIGEVVNYVKSSGLANNTIILYVGDNGTDESIYSDYKNTTVKGGKSETYATGIQQSMIVWSPGFIAPHQVNNNIIDFTDFLPSIADMAKIPKPTTYGTLDGVSFYPYITGQTGTPRSWVFCDYDQNEEGEGLNPIQRWINNTNYKLYDTTGLFFNIKKDLLEKSPIPDNKLTPAEKATKNYFQSVLNTLH